MLTLRWRREAQFAAVTAFRTLVAKKTVLEAANYNWDIASIHDSVLQLRDEMASAIPTVTHRAAAVGEAAVQTCRSYALTLRNTATTPTTADDGLGAHPELHRQHGRWVQQMQSHVAELDKIRRMTGPDLAES